LTAAYVVLAHDDPHMLRRLLGALEGAPTIIHLDARVDLQSFERVARVGALENARYASIRTPVNWGGYSAVRTMLSAGDELGREVSRNDHLVFVSGRCYPLRPVREFYDFLARSEWRQHCRAYDLKAAGQWHLDRIALRHGFDGFSTRLGRHGTLRRRLTRRLLKEANRLSPRLTTALRPVAGSQWMALTTECFNEAREATASAEYAIFLNSFAPDEMAIQTFVHNSRWSLETRFLGAEQSGDFKVSSYPNFHALDPKMIGSVSSESVRAALPDQFFARKFDSIRDEALLNRIDHECQREELGERDGRSR